MATNDSTSNTSKISSLHESGNRSTLHCIISNAHLLHQTGYDKKINRVTYVGDTSDLHFLEGCADASITTIARGISVIGKLLVHDDKPLSYIDDSEIAALGWFLNDLGATIVALQNIQVMASNAVSYAKD